MNEKAHFLDRVSRKMQEDFQSAELPARDALASAFRILAGEGHESGSPGG